MNNVDLRSQADHRQPASRGPSAPIAIDARRLRPRAGAVLT
jgi:hypothetical protein